MAEPATLRVKGYTQFVRAANHAGPEARRAVRLALREAGEPVKDTAARLFKKYDKRSAAGFRIGVLQRGVIVEQGLRKVTGKRPDYGALQMRKALIPALDREQAVVEDRVERAIDLIADHFDS